MLHNPFSHFPALRALLGIRYKIQFNAQFLFDERCHDRPDDPDVANDGDAVFQPGTTRPTLTPPIKPYNPPITASMA
jgi:hypothetical protein